MTRKWGNLLFAGLLVAVLAAMVVRAQEWPFNAKLFPLAIGYPMLALSVVVFVRTALKLRSPGEEPTDEIFEVELPPEVLRQRAFVIVAWLALSGLLLWAFGLRVGIPVWAFLFLYLQGRQALWLSALLALATGALLVGFFDMVAHIPWPTAQLSRVTGIRSVAMMGVFAGVMAAIAVVADYLWRARRQGPAD